MGFFRNFFGGSTAETEANESLSSSLAGVVGGIIGTVMVYLGGAYVSLTADASTPSLSWLDTASMNPGIKTVDSVVGGSYEAIASVSGEVPAAFAVYSPVIASTSTGVSGESSGADEWIAIIFRKDAMPYSRIEKRAEKIFSQFQKGDEKKEEFPTIIAHDQEMFDAFLPIYGSSIKSLKENLEIMEAALRNESCN